MGAAGIFASPGAAAGCSAGTAWSGASGLSGDVATGAGLAAVDGFDLVRVTASFPLALTGGAGGLAGAVCAAAAPNERAQASAQRTSAFFMDAWTRVREETAGARGDRTLGRQPKGPER
jgi:hypothetical protein